MGSKTGIVEAEKVSEKAETVVETVENELGWSLGYKTYTDRIAVDAAYLDYVDHTEELDVTGAWWNCL